MKSQNFDDKPVITKSKRGRKALAVSEELDVTGKTHFMVVRRPDHPTPKKKAPKTPKAIIPSNNYCAQCEQKDKDIDELNDQIKKLKTNTQLIDKSSNIVAADLDNSSNQINHELFEGVGMQLQNQFSTTTITLTPTIRDLYDRIGKIERHLNMSIPQPLSFIGTEMPFEMQCQMAPTTLLTHPYEPEDLTMTSDLSPFNLPKQY
ncbi:5624_t:CDS:1 [Funneliformis caledonium]|uniref:5624_t:CDS:1 n=1 Tax=Funneliformis caledonium TaxID=1117310 RepID=A0A9N9NUB4_9GLOM|nr:5624_t:CDS:1 [Funneliformis caledonium]